MLWCWYSYCMGCLCMVRYDKYDDSQLLKTKMVSIQIQPNCLPRITKRDGRVERIADSIVQINSRTPWSDHRVWNSDWCQSSGRRSGWWRNEARGWNRAGRIWRSWGTSHTITGFWDDPMHDCHYSSSEKKNLIRFCESHYENRLDFVLSLSPNAWAETSINSVYSLKLVYNFVLTEV